MFIIGIYRGKERVGVIEYVSREQYEIKCDDELGYPSASAMCKMSMHMANFATGFSNAMTREKAINGEGFVWYEIEKWPNPGENNA